MALLQGKGRIARFAVFLFIMFLSWPKCYAKTISSARWWVGSWQLNKTLFLSMKDEDKKWISLFQRQDALQDRKVPHFIANMRVFSRAHICTEQTWWLSFFALHCQGRWCTFACSRHSISGCMWLKMCELHGWKRHTSISHNIEISGKFLMYWDIWVCQPICGLWQWLMSWITLPADWILSLVRFEDKPRFPIVLGETVGTGACHHF